MGPMLTSQASSLTTDTTREIGTTMPQARPAGNKGRNSEPPEKHPHVSEIVVKDRGSKKRKIGADPMGQTPGPEGAPSISHSGNPFTLSGESVPTAPPGENSTLQNSGSEELVKLMMEHDEENRGREIHSRYFYAPRWGLSWVTYLSPGDDKGEITFRRYLPLEDSDLEGIDRYLQFIRWGEQVDGTKIMIRLRSVLNQAGEEVSGWPPKTKLLFNTQELKIQQVLCALGS